jgi:Na+/proline symporter
MIAAPRSVYPASDLQLLLFGFEVPTSSIGAIPILIAFFLGVSFRKANAWGIALALIATLTFWITTALWLSWLEIGRVGQSRFSVEGYLLKSPIVLFYLAFFVGMLLPFVINKARAWGEDAKASNVRPPECE